MNRREFLVFMGVGAVAAVVAPKLLADCSVPPPGWRCTREAGHKGPCAAVETVEFTSSHAYKPGDIVEITGFIDRQYNGTYIVQAQPSFFAKMQ